MKRFDPERKKALVIGGSMSGLLAARILSDFYDEVTILERDDLSNEVENRRGVPQGWHAHGLLAGGSQVLEELFPDISTELAAAGAVTADVVKDGKWFFEGDCLVQVPSGTSGLLLSRPFLENAVRRRVRSLAAPGYRCRGRAGQAGGCGAPAPGGCGRGWGTAPAPGSCRSAAAGRCNGHGPGA